MEDRYRLSLEGALEQWKSAARHQGEQIIGLQVEVRALRNENRRLREALEAMMKLVDDGLLVRDTSKDHESGWGLRALPIVQGLQQAQAALETHP